MILTLGEKVAMVEVEKEGFVVELKTESKTHESQLFCKHTEHLELLDLVDACDTMMNTVEIMKAKQKFPNLHIKETLLDYSVFFLSADGFKYKVNVRPSTVGAKLAKSLIIG